MSPKKAAAAPKPVPPWRRAEAGQYRSSDERFTIGSEGPSRWFVTDEQEQDELGLARTLGPFATLDAAKAGAEEHRGRLREASPLADRLARAAAPKAGGGTEGSRARTKGSKAPSGDEPAAKAPARAPRKTPAAPPPPPRTWLDTLEDEDRDAARRARRLIAALEKSGMRDAEEVVRRDVLGKQPVVAARLLATAILAAVDEATDSDALDAGARALPAGQRAGARPRLAAMAAVEAVIEILGGSGSRGELPGWQLVERDGQEDGSRTLRLTGDDLRGAARATTRVDHDR